ncbi:NAD(P)/FAD-dependent oxidoreductase [Thiosulfatihalobacter marinus]|uniref:NAD(P)/FAD-dependent oxidoreductase n=1 Tax=Thiosulfatihalobacter marinus TaxID=2792481 RepID=UPI002FBDBF35
MRRVAIIGSGLAGMACAAKLRAEGFAGEIRMFNAEPCPPYEKPGLSKGRIGLDVPVSLVAPDLMYEAAARSISVTERTVGTRSRIVGPFDHIVLATGRAVVRLPGFDDAVTLRTLADAQRLRLRLGGQGRVAIVGAGLIGMELAAALSQEGVPVTLVEAGPRAMMRVVPAAISDNATARMRDANVDVRFATQLSRQVAGELVLSDGTSIPADVVVAAIGTHPDTDLARRAGVAVSKTGIIVSPDMRASFPGIWAVGDCATVQMADETFECQNYAAARDMGEAAALGILGHRPDWQPNTWLWSDQGETRIEGVGQADGTHDVTDYPDGGCSVSVSRAGRLVGQFAIGSRKALRTVRKAQSQIMNRANEQEAV